jgi:hypothetical protein
MVRLDLVTSTERVKPALTLPESPARHAALTPILCALADLSHTEIADLLEKRRRLLSSDCRGHCNGHCLSHR